MYWIFYKMRTIVISHGRGEGALGNNMNIINEYYYHCIRNTILPGGCGVSITGVRRLQGPLAPEKLIIAYFNISLQISKSHYFHVFIYESNFTKYGLLSTV